MSDNDINRPRRRILKAGLALALGSLGTDAALGAAIRPSTGARALELYHLHTGESLNATYWENGSYLPDALAEINRLLRDFRTDTVFPIAPPLLDLLCNLHAALGATRPFQIISGYRSPQTNTFLAAHTEGVARHSLHMDGMAVDINIDGVALTHLRDAALALGGGGVGYYPQSQFVHVDIGRVRSW
jgi:uncharacterized protein YcbK (DUF882 family)